MRSLIGIIRFFRGIVRKIIVLKNWYWPNFAAFLKKRIILKGKTPICFQFTIISGEGKTIIGNGCKFGSKMGGRHRHGSIEFQARNKNAQIIISDNVLTNNNIFVCAENYITIGKHTLIGEGVTIMDHEPHGIDAALRMQVGEIGKVEIGNNVWVGNSVIILKNTIIGDNTIVAAGAVVTGKFGANLIIGGVPAKVIKAL